MGDNLWFYDSKDKQINLGYRKLKYVETNNAFGLVLVTKIHDAFS